MRRREDGHRRVPRRRQGLVAATAPPAGARPPRDGFSGKAQAAGRIAGQVLAGGLLLAGAAAVKATKAAAEDEAAQSQLAQQLRAGGGRVDGQIASTEAWIAAQGKATGITDDELRPALAGWRRRPGTWVRRRTGGAGDGHAAGSQKSYQPVTEASRRPRTGTSGRWGEARGRHQGRRGQHQVARPDPAGPGEQVHGRCREGGRHLRRQDRRSCRPSSASCRSRSARSCCR